MNSSEGWENITVEDLGEIVAGGTPDRTNPSYWGGSIPWVTPTEITGLKGKYLRETAEYITEAGLAGSAARLLPIGTVVVTTRATLGETAIATVPLATNQGFKNVVPNKETDPLFAYYLLRTLRPEMIRLSSGTTFLEISKSDFARIKTRWPKIDDQRRIAAVLDTVDEAIAKTEAVIAKLRQVRTGMLHDLLTWGVDENGQIRDPIAHPEQFRDSPLGFIPVDWGIIAVSQLCEFISYGFTNPMPTTEEGPWMVTALDIGDGEIRYDQARHTSQHAFDNFLTPKSRPKIGDILVTKDGTLGRVAKVDREPVCINQSVAVLRLLPSSDAKFLSQYLRSPMGQASMLAEVGGSTIKHIYISKLRDILIPYPTEKDRRQISEVLESSESHIQVEVQKLVKFTNCKSGLMFDLLTGRVRVPEDLELTK